MDIPAPRRSRRAAIAASLIVLLAAGLTACGGDDEGSSGEVPAGSVALVGSQDITRAQLDQLMTQAQETYKTQGRPFPKTGTTEYTDLQSQALQYLVNQTRLEEAAKELDVAVSKADIDKGVEDLRKQVAPSADGKGVDEKKYADMLKAQGVTAEQVREQVEGNLRAERIYTAVTKDIKVNDADVQAYYDKNKKTYTTPETRKVRHILVKNKALADQLYAQLKNDDSQFATLAKKHSEDKGSGAVGGDLLPSISKGQTVPEFDKEAFSIKEGVVSQPVKTQFGYHLIEATGPVVAATTKPLDAALKKEILAQLEKTKKDEAAQKWFEDLKKRLDADTTYAEGFAPPASTPTPTGAATTPATTTAS